MKFALIIVLAQSGQPAFVPVGRLDDAAACDRAGARIVAATNVASAPAVADFICLPDPPPG